MFRGTTRILLLGLRPKYSNMEESDFKPLCSARNSLNHCAVNRRGVDFRQAYHINWWVNGLHHFLTYYSKGLLTFFKGTLWSIWLYDHWWMRYPCFSSLLSPVHFKSEQLYSTQYTFRLYQAKRDCTPNEPCRPFEWNFRVWLLSINHFHAWILCHSNLRILQIMKEIVRLQHFSIYLSHCYSTKGLC